MPMESQPSPSPHAFFTAAAGKFQQLREWLSGGAQAKSPHQEVEAYVLLEVRELGRLLVQAHMDLRTEREKPLPVPTSAPAEAHRRIITRTLRTVLGVVSVGRVAWQARGEVTVIPLGGTTPEAGLWVTSHVERLLTRPAA